MKKTYREKYSFSQLFGFGQFRIVNNENTENIDFEVIDTNAMVEDILGANRSDLIGKYITDISPENGNLYMGWSPYIENVLRSKQSQEIIKWIDKYNDYYKITIMPSSDNIFAVVIQKDITASGLDVKYDGNDVPWAIDSFFNTTHDAVLLVENIGEEFRFLRNNIIHQKITGFTNLRGATPVEILGEEIGKRLLSYYKQCIQTGKMISYEQNYDFAYGERIWHTEITPVFGRGGVNYLVCSSKDITELKTIKSENEVLAARLKSMFNSHEAIMLIIKPISGEIMDANPSACDFYGYSKTELQNMVINDINMLPDSEVKKYRIMSFEKKQSVFIFPHRLKTGEVRLVEVYSCPISDGVDKLLYSIIFDVTDRENYKNELFREKEILSTTLRSIGDGVVTTNDSGLITSLNFIAEDITGWSNEEAMGQKFSNVFKFKNEITGRMIDDPVKQVLKKGEIVVLPKNTVLVNKQNKMISISDTAAPIIAENGDVLGVVMVFRDLSGEKEQNLKIQYLNDHDKLTGLYNRHFAESNINMIDTKDNLPLSVIIGDINGLKIFNDLFGHEAGNEFINNIAESMIDTCKKSDVIIRWGGDEFVILSPHTSLEMAENKITEIKNRISERIGENNHTSISFGCAVKERPYENIQEIISEAEKNMYHQKMLDVKSYRNSIISTLLATLYEKSSETEEHSKRLELYSHLIGKKLKLSSSEMDELSLLAMLHDIGKVKIHQNILQKPGALSPEEWEEMKTHSEAGYRIIKASTDLSAIADYILSHHERWDGKGYPNELHGEEIPLLCRIISITDAYDAMTNDRVYRSAMTKEEAISELIKNSGIQFDPLVTEIFIDILTNET